MYTFLTVTKAQLFKRFILHSMSESTFRSYFYTISISVRISQALKKYFIFDYFILPNRILKRIKVYII